MSRWRIDGTAVGGRAAGSSLAGIVWLRVGERQVTRPTTQMRPIQKPVTKVE